MVSTSQPFVIPIYLDLIAVFVMAITGAVAAIRRGYDYVGVVTLAFLVGVGGGILRDGLFLQRVPLAMRVDGYLATVLAACVAGFVFTRVGREIGILMLVIDAIGVGAYAVFGTQASLEAGVSLIGAALIGVINSVGGGLLRDIFMREEPLLFKPSEHYAGAALLGIIVFAALDHWGVGRSVAGILGVIATTALRILSVYFGWRTRAVAPVK